jgi:hypothetical protein
MAVLYPRDDFARVFHVLLDLAGGDASVIKTTTDGPGLGLVFPDELFDRFVEQENGTDSSEEEEPQAPKKRPGRPKKVQE